jgi:hypothetical protein
MSLVGCLARHPQRLGDLLPRPPFVNRAFHGIALHAVGETAEADDRRDRGGRVLGRGDHAGQDTLRTPRLSIYVDTNMMR